MTHRRVAVSALLAGALAVVTLGVPAAGAAVAHPAATAAKSTVTVQGGTTPVDSGLFQAVIAPGFARAYPQYRLQYVSVGTGQAITNAENGLGDAVLTHSSTLEDQFVSQGYSYEPGGRLVMTSDFVTVGSPSDPAGVKTGPAHDVVAAFKEIAAAGNNGTADFVSRADASGTNVKELSIWKLTGIPVNSLGNPGTPGTTTDAAWYHRTGLGQGDNLNVTDQCPFPSGSCYTLTDRGTYNNLVTNGSIDLTVVSQDNTAAAALGGVALLTNPYHVYAVNPQKEPGVKINLAGALAFMNYLTSEATQTAIGAYPSTSAPAFVPDAAPVITLTQKPPASVTAGQSVTVSGTDLPNFPLDPSNAGAPVLLTRAGATGTIARTTVASDGTFSLTFTPTRTDTYEVFVPQYRDGLITPTNTAFRRAVTVSTGRLVVKAAVTLAISQQSGTSVDLTGTAAPASGRIAATVTIQIKDGGTWKTLGSPVALAEGQSSYAVSVTVPSGTSKLRALYQDPGAVANGTSAVVSVSAP